MQSKPHVPSGATGADFRQDVRSPKSVWGPVLDALGRTAFSIDLFNDERTRGNVPALQYVVHPRDDARSEPWIRPCRTRLRWSAWGNPPFDSLAWVLEMAARHPWRAHGAELTLLVPVRPHRRYWRFAWTADVEVHLPAFAFEGEVNTFPLPCCLLHWGPDAKGFAERLTIGTVVRSEPLTQCVGDDTIPRMSQEHIPIAKKLLCAAAFSARASGIRSLREMADLFPGLWGGIAELTLEASPRPEGEYALRIAAQGLGEALAVLMVYAPAFLDTARVLGPTLTAADLFAGSHGPIERALRGEEPKAKAELEVVPEPEPAQPGAKPKKKPPTNKAKTGSKRSASDELADFLKERKKGDRFALGEFLKAVDGGISRASASRACGESDRIQSNGRGRAAYWEVVA